MRLALVGLLGLSMLKGCDFGDPATVEPQLKEALQPYFPKVQVTALPAQHALVGLTCLSNAGSGLVDMVGPSIANNPSMSKLKLLRMVPGSSYQKVGLGFEQAVVVYDVDTGTFNTVPMGAEYSSTYRKECRLDQAGDSGGGAHAWIGYFSGTADCGNNNVRTVHTVDTLGVWPTREFLDRHVDAQTERITATWQAAWSKQNCQLSNVRLDGVRDVQVPTTRPSD